MVKEHNDSFLESYHKSIKDYQNYEKKIQQLYLSCENYKIT